MGKTKNFGPQSINLVSSIQKLLIFASDATSSSSSSLPLREGGRGEGEHPCDECVRGEAKISKLLNMMTHTVFTVVQSLSLLHKTSMKRAEGKFGSYAFDLKRGYVLDPTGADGKLLPEYQDIPIFRVNEPNHDQEPNAAFRKSRNARNRIVIEMVTIKPIKAGEEVLASYGDQYLRLY